MKRLRSRGWLLVLSALMLMLALGAVACGSDSDDSAKPAAMTQNGGERMRDTADVENRARPRVQAPPAQRGEAMQDRREARTERREALLDDLRDKMSAEDQALFDELQSTVEEQRGTLEEDRQELADTLKELRALTDKYLGLDSEQDAR